MVTKVCVIDGAKAIVVNDRIVPRESLARSVEALRKRVAEELPAAKGKLNATKLLEQAQGNVDRQIANEQATLDTLTGLLDEFDKAR